MSQQHSSHSPTAQKATQPVEIIGLNLDETSTIVLFVSPTASYHNNGRWRQELDAVIPICLERKRRLKIFVCDKPNTTNDMIKHGKVDLSAFNLELRPYAEQLSRGLGTNWKNRNVTENYDLFRKLTDADLFSPETDLITAWSFHEKYKPLLDILLKVFTLICGVSNLTDLLQLETSKTEFQSNILDLIRHRHRTVVFHERDNNNRIDEDKIDTLNLEHLAEETGYTMLWGLLGTNQALYPVSEDKNEATFTMMQKIRNEFLNNSSSEMVALKDELRTEAEKLQLHPLSFDTKLQFYDVKFPLQKKSKAFATVYRGTDEDATYPAAAAASADLSAQPRERTHSEALPVLTSNDDRYELLGARSNSAPTTTSQPSAAVNAFTNAVLNSRDLTEAGAKNAAMLFLELTELEAKKKRDEELRILKARKEAASLRTAVSAGGSAMYASRPLHATTAVPATSAAISAAANGNGHQPSGLSPRRASGGT